MFWLLLLSKQIWFCFIVNIFSDAISLKTRYTILYFVCFCLVSHLKQLYLFGIIIIVMWYLPKIYPGKELSKLPLWFLMFFRVCRQANKHNQYYHSPERVPIYLFQFTFSSMLTPNILYICILLVVYLNNIYPYIYLVSIY